MSGGRESFRSAGVLPSPRWSGTRTCRRLARLGSVSRPATREQRGRLHAIGEMLQADQLPVSGSRFAKLGMDRPNTCFTRPAEAAESWLRVGTSPERRPVLPAEAVREAIENAVAHRDPTRDADIEHVRYGGRLEVTSPGSLPNAMTMEEMLASNRASRNPRIVAVLRHRGCVNTSGMGVRKTIVPLMREPNETEPEFVATEDPLRVTRRGDGQVRTWRSHRRPEAPPAGTAPWIRANPGYAARA